MYSQIIELSRSGTQLMVSQETLESVSMEFRRNHFVRLPQLIEPKLLQRISDLVGSVQFLQREHKQVGLEMAMADPAAQSMMMILINNSTMFRLVEQITGCEKIGSFIGRVYKYLPHEQHFDEWHSDLVQDRM